jgi:hypothetical protein
MKHHKTHLTFDTNSYTFRHQSAVLREFIKNNESEVPHVLQLPVTLNVIMEVKILKILKFQSTNVHKYKTILLY